MPAGSEFQNKGAATLIPRELEECSDAGI